MADIKYLSNIDLNGNKLKNPVIDTQTSDPGTPNVGQAYYNTSQDKLRIYDGSAWQQVGATYSFSSSNGVLTLKEDGVATTPTFTITGGSGITLDNGTANTVEITVANSDVLSLLSNLESSSGAANENITIGADAGDTISFTGNVTVAGNLTINGDASTINTATLSVEDPLIILASGNNGSDSIDIGLYGLYDTSGTDKYSGLFRDASDGKWNLFKDLTAAPTTTVDKSGTGYTVATLIANVEGNITGQASDISNHNSAIDTRADARIDLRSSAHTITGNNSTTEFTITYGFTAAAVNDVIVQVVDSSGAGEGDTVFVEIERHSTTECKIQFSSAPATSKTYRVLCFKVA